MENTMFPFSDEEMSLDISTRQLSKTPSKIKERFLMKNITALECTKTYQILKVKYFKKDYDNQNLSRLFFSSKLKTYSF